MTGEQVGGLVRTIAGLGLGFLVGKNYIDAPTAASITAALGGLAIAAWSFFSKTKKA